MGCQVTDAATTIYALSLGAVELNPVGIIVVLGAKIYIIYWTVSQSKEEWEAQNKGARAVISLAGCIPAANNINVIRQLRNAP